ncbi:hypothetical protein BDZ89DRAFT_406284 [Hymenopellis radicata]|nr:hypothetical protein BDZ89DRAFT_406284 [Hymenopellis radicata]
MEALYCKEVELRNVLKEASFLLIRPWATVRSGHELNGGHLHPAGHISLVSGSVMSLWTPYHLETQAKSNVT